MHHREPSIFQALQIIVLSQCMSEGVLFEELKNIVLSLRWTLKTLVSIFELGWHEFAVDTQLSLSFPIDCRWTVIVLNQCLLGPVTGWLWVNRLGSCYPQSIISKVLLPLTFQRQQSTHIPPLKDPSTTLPHWLRQWREPRPRWGARPVNSSSPLTSSSL